jgi:hypothetical protein
VSSQVLCASTFNFNVSFNFSISIHFEFSITFQLALALALISWSFFQQLNLDFLSDGQSRLGSQSRTPSFVVTVGPIVAGGLKDAPILYGSKRVEPWPCRLQDYQKRIIRL